MPLVIQDGLAGAVLGLLIGNAVALVVSLIAIRHSWVPAFEGQFVSLIARRGTTWMPLVLSFWVIQEGSLFLLAQFAEPAEVGVFRVATQVAAFGGFVLVAFLRASGPISREPIYKAVRRERGPDMIGTVMTTYFAYGSIFVLLAFALAADVLVRIAPPSYAEAAALVPVLVLAAVANGWFRVIYRYSRFPNKQRAKITWAVVAGVVFVASAVFLIPEFGAFGVGWAATLAFTVAAAGLFVMSWRSETPIRFAHRRIAAGLFLGAACYGAARALEDLVGAPSPVTATLAIVAYPALLVVSRVIPQRHIGPLRDISRASLPVPQGNGSLKLKKLSKRQHRVLKMLVRDGRSPADVAETTAHIGGGGRHDFRGGSAKGQWPGQAGLDRCRRGSVPPAHRRDRRQGPRLEAPGGRWRGPARDRRHAHHADADAPCAPLGLEARWLNRFRPASPSARR